MSHSSALKYGFKYLNHTQLCVPHGGILSMDPKTRKEVAAKLMRFFFS